jgi:tetratricopeptide (TPR) repeat protein
MKSRRFSLALAPAAMLGTMMVVAGAAGGRASAAEKPNACVDHFAPPEQRIAACTAVIKSGGNQATMVEAYACRGIAYFMLKKYDNTIADETAGIALHPPDLETLAAMYSVRSDAENELDRLDAAIKDADETIKLEPKDESHWTSRCLYRMRQGTALQAALADCNTAVHLNTDDDADCYRIRAAVEIKLKNFPAAIADSNDALKRNPGSVSDIYIRAIAKRGAGDAAGAAADLAAAKAKDPDIAEKYVSWRLPSP